MIFSFNIQNFLSIHDLTVDLTPRRTNNTTVDKKRGPFDQVQLLECQGSRTVPVLSILGFNGSGKSNVMLAFIQMIFIAAGVSTRDHKFYRPCAEPYKNQPKFTSLSLKFSYTDGDSGEPGIAEYSVACGTSGLIFEKLCCQGEEVIRFEDGQIIPGPVMYNRCPPEVVGSFTSHISSCSLRIMRGHQVLQTSMLSCTRSFTARLPVLSSVLDEFTGKFFYISPYYQSSILDSLSELDRLIVRAGGTPGSADGEVDGTMTALRLLNEFLNEISHGDRLEMPRGTRKKLRDGDLICVHHGRRDREYRVSMNTESNSFYHSCMMLANCLKAIVTGGVIFIDDINLYQPPVSQLFMQQLFKSSYNRLNAQLICTLNGNKVVIPNTDDRGDEMAYIEKDQQKGPQLIRGFDLCKNSNIRMQGFKMPFDLGGEPAGSESPEREPDEGVKPVLNPRPKNTELQQENTADAAESTDAASPNTDEDAEEESPLREDGVIFVGKGNC